MAWAAELGGPGACATTAQIHGRPVGDNGGLQLGTICMNDFHMAMLWLRALEIAIGHFPMMLSELEFNDLFSRYRSPYKA